MIKKKPEVLAIIPVRNDWLAKARLGGRWLVDYTLDAARSARWIRRIVISTDSPSVRREVIRRGFEAPFLRPRSLTRPGVMLDQVLRHATLWLETHEDYRPDVVVLLEITHPFRDRHLIDRVIQTLTTRKLDTVFIAHMERENFWQSAPNGSLIRVNPNGYRPRHQQPPLYREASGVACATRSDFIRRGTRLGDQVGLVPVASSVMTYDIRTPVALAAAETMLSAARKSVSA